MTNVPTTKMCVSSFFVRFLFFATCLCGVLAQGASRGAAQTTPTIDHFSVSRFSPAVGSGNFLSTEGASVGGHLAPSAGLTLDYALSPFVVYAASCTDPVNQTGCTTTGVDTAVVNHLFMAHIYGSFSLADRVQIGLTLPIGIGIGSTYAPTINQQTYTVPGGGGFGLGDPRLSVKGRIYGGETGFSVAASAFLSAPLAAVINSNTFIGDQSIVVGGSAIGQFVHGGIQVALNVGGYYRKPHTFFSTRVGPQFTYRLAGGYEITKGFLLFAELDGGTSFRADIDENPLEVRIGGRYRTDTLLFNFGVGTGILAGVGVPALRVVAGGSWAPTTADSDGDGIPDRQDKCPNEPEDKDGFEDADGCPDPDNDKDGIPDAKDKCPNDPEDLDGFEDTDGCPEPDNDKDGVPDGYDSCPNQAGPKETQGCPSNDRDKDGIPDDVDKCPDQPEDVDGFEDADGCPDPDNDKDGIPDDKDDCPDEAGTKARFGCP